MRTKLEKLVKVCELAEARVKRKLLIARIYEAECRHAAAHADKTLKSKQLELQAINRRIVDSNKMTIHNLQSVQRYLDGVREGLEQLRGKVRKAHAALAEAEYERSQLSTRVLAASVKLENARLREARWCCQRDAINASQQEEYAIESWVLRLR